MKKLKSLLSSALVALLSAALILPLAACVEDDPNNGGGNTSDSNSVYVASRGGMALPDVTVELYMNGSSVSSTKTDKEGKVTYNLNSDNKYEVKLSDVPPGFIVEDSYEVKGSEQDTHIYLDSQIIKEETPENLLYNTGDVLYDFTETYFTYNPDGSEPTSRTVSLSDFFKEGKKAVLIDFFYISCSNCNDEYPALRNAYNKYSKDLAVIGINDIDPDTSGIAGENEPGVKSLVQLEKVPYLMCYDEGSVIGRHFGNFVSGYPTAIMIDRYGILCEVLFGKMESQTFWETWFEKYTSDNYAQGVTKGEEPSTIFTPDLPGDFVSIPDSTELTAKVSPKINNTGRNVIFSAFGENNSAGWPWDLTEDQTAIYPTNSGHLGTGAIMYAQVDLEKDEVLAFDYKLSTMEGSDYLFVSVDSREGTGRQLSMDSGISEWQTGYSYVALEAGRHEIEFTYLRSTGTALNSVEDKVYIKNLRIVTVDEMNEDLTENKATYEIPYLATRNYNNDTKQFENIENVYLAEDGYYHIGTEETATKNDPYLLLDITHSTPYFGKNSESILTLLNSEISEYGGLYIDGEDYTDIFRSYLSFSSNSTYSGLIPVNAEIQETISALYKDNIPKDAPYYSKDGWLQFCVYYKQYGVQKDISDPIKGLAYFSAFKANETTGQENFMEVGKGQGKFIFDETLGKFVDVEGTRLKDEGNYVLNPAINQVHFETPLMPRGLLYEFKPEVSGVYSFNGIDCYYYNDDASAIDDEVTDANLYDGDLKLSHSQVRPIASSGSDRYDRNDIPKSFKIVHYLEAGKTYYLEVEFHVFETTGDFAFRIDYLGESHSYIYQAAADSYYLDENNSMAVPLFCEPTFNDTHTYDFGDGKGNQPVWYDNHGGGLIFVDFTQLSLLFYEFTIEQVLNDNFKSAQFTLDISKETFTDEFGNVYNISLDLEKRYGGVNNIPDTLKEVLKDYPIADYTATMRYYLEKSKEGKEVTDEEYGLIPVNKELYSILQLYNAKFLGFDTPDEWLKACCFRLNINENNHSYKQPYGTN